MSGTIARAVAQQAERPTVGAFIQRLAPEIQRALPRHLDGDRVARLALTEVRKNPKLGECIPESFAGAILTAAAIGVEVGTPEAYLVPYKGECTLIIGYQGYTKLFWQHPAAQTLDAEVVYEKDEFDWQKGTSPYLKHKPYKGEGGRGKIVYYYAAVTLSTGGSHFEVLTPDEVKQLRGGKIGTSGGIADPMHWMERKTAIRQVLKPMPKSSQLAQAVQSDERDGTSLYMERVAENVPAAIGSERRQIDGQTVNVSTGELLDDKEPTQEVLDEIAAGK
jgi:recombination protein RecT